VLHARLGLLGMRMITIAGDGNCQFRAVSLQLYGSEAHHALVRHRALEYIRERRAEFACFYAGVAAFERYLTLMSRDRSWGDELTLRAITNAFGVSIHVVTSTEANWHLTYTPDRDGGSEATAGRKHLFLAYVAPVHYNAFELASEAVQGGEKRVAAGAANHRRTKGKRELVDVDVDDAAQSAPPPVVRRRSSRIA
jgi:hypothetical protein